MTLSEQLQRGQTAERKRILALRNGVAQKPNHHFCTPIVPGAFVQHKAAIRKEMAAV